MKKKDNNQQEFPSWTQQLLNDLRKKPGQADLHTHTTISDGTESLFALARAARAAGVFRIAVSDHDHVLSQEDADYYTLTTGGVDIIPAVELNTSYQLSGKHIILHNNVLWPPENDPEFSALVAHNQSQPRKQYVKAFLQNLCDLGIDPSGRGVDASYRMIEERNPDSKYLGKGAVAQLLVDTGFCRDRREAQQKYLSRGSGRAFVPAEDHFRFVKFPKLMEVINKYNQTAPKRAAVILNHLFYYGLDRKNRELLVKDFANMGGKFLEVYYGPYLDDEARIEELLGYCEKYHLLPTGGSDRHHPSQPFSPISEDHFAKIMDYHLREDYIKLEFHLSGDLWQATLPPELVEQLRECVAAVPGLWERNWGLLYLNETQYQRWLKTITPDLERAPTAKQMFQTVSHKPELLRDQDLCIPSAAAQYLKLPKNSTLRACHLPGENEIFLSSAIAAPW